MVVSSGTFPIFGKNKGSDKGKGRDRKKERGKSKDVPGAQKIFYEPLGKKGAHKKQ